MLLKKGQGRKASKSKQADL